MGRLALSGLSALAKILALHWALDSDLGARLLTVLSAHNAGILALYWALDTGMGYWLMSGITAHARLLAREWVLGSRMALVSR